MRIARVSKNGKIGLASKSGDAVTVVWDEALADLDTQIANGTLAAAGAKAAAGDSVDEASTSSEPT